MRCPWYEKTMRKLEVDLLSKWCTACMFNVRKIKMTWFWKYTNEMPRLNLGLESRENVTSSLTKVDWKSKLVELPASWPSQRRSLHHCELAELLREKKINRRRKILDQNNWMLCCKNVLPKWNVWLPLSLCCASAHSEPEVPGSQSSEQAGQAGGDVLPFSFPQASSAGKSSPPVLSSMLGR